MHAWHNSMTEQDPTVLPVNFEEVGRKRSSGTFKSGDYNTEQMDSFTDALRLLYRETGDGDSEERLPPSARAMVKEMAPEWLERCGANLCLITSSGRLERHTAVESPMLTHAFGMIYWKVLKAEEAVAKCAIFTDLGIELKFTTRATAYTVADKTSMAYFVACAVKINPSLPAFSPAKPGDTSGPATKPEPEHFVAFKRVPLSTVHGTT
jgi:hypothetical protein